MLTPPLVPARLRSGLRRQRRPCAPRVREPEKLRPGRLPGRGPAVPNDES